MRFTTFVPLAVLCSLAAALPARRDCSAEIAAFNTARAAKRSFIPVMSNTTCVLSPEVAMKNHVNGVTVRKDVTDGQAGVAFTLDVGVMNINTCQPLTGAMVEIWSANAVGNYGSFLRGAQTTGSNGIAEFQTIYPGFSSDGTNHINIAVHQDGTMNSGTAHAGQLFFTDPWNNILSMYTNYNQNTHTRMLNAQDPNFKTANAGGYSAIVSVNSIHDDWPEGVIGYITVGVNPSNLV